jgi:hypothetical protein
MAAKNRDSSQSLDGLRRIQQDPLNLNEYMMADARSPRIEFLLQRSPSQSLASSASPQISSAFPDQSIQRAYTDFRPNYISSSMSQLSESSAFESGTDHKMSQGSGGHNFGLDDLSADTAENPSKEKKDVKIEPPPPPWSEMKTKAGKDRKRLPLACIACRRKKIRCSGEKPACKHCLRSRIPCVYKVTTRKATPRTDYMAMLDKRLKRMEDRVIKLIPKDSQAVSIPRAILKPALPVPPPKPGKKRSLDEAFGVDKEIAQWAKPLQGNNGENTSFPLKKIDSDEHKLLTEGAEALPSREIQEHLAEVYFDYVYGQSYPLLHKPSFMRKLAAGTVPPVLILAVCAVSARFSNHPQVRTEPAFLRGENWASFARDIALRRYDSPNITILIVYILLGLHEFGTCQGGRSWMLGGMAMRMAFALQLHKDLDHETWTKDKKDHVLLSPTDREIRRRTMWACLLMDRFNSSGTDRPMTISEEWINVPLPIKEKYFQFELSGPTETINGKVLHPAQEDSGQLSNARENMGTSAFYIKLVLIWGRIVRYWNLGGRNHETSPIWSTHSEFHKIKESLKKFHTELPDSMRYNVENLHDHTTQRVANQFLFMHIVYHQLVLFMHRFALPYSGYGRLPKDIPYQFQTESARTALEAANQISTLIKEAMNHNVVAPFAGYCAFYSSTVHIQGIFSKNPKLESMAKQNLTYNVRYISKMKKYWGMFHFVAENLKDLYRQHADIALKGGGVTAGNKHIFQYGDWFDRYPHGVSHTDYPDPATEPNSEPGTDAVLGQKSGLQSVEEFFATLPQPREAEQRKANKKGRTSKGRQNSAPSGPISSTPHPNNKRTNTDISTSQQQQQKQQPSQITIDHNPVISPTNHFDAKTPTFNNPFMSNHDILGFGAHLHDSSISTPSLPPQSGMLSQLDRHLVLSSYAGLDPSSAQQIAQSMTNNNGGVSSMDSGTTNGMSGLSWTGLDVGGEIGGGANISSGAFNDTSTHWFMPFNLSPPEVVGDDGAMGLTYGISMDGFAGDGLAAGLNLSGVSGTVNGGGGGEREEGER